MSFFFGKKKGQTPSADPPRSGPGSRDPSGGGPTLNAAPVNGAKGKVPPVAGTPAAQTPTPGSSVNNSISNSINGAKTPSPDQGRDGPGVGVAGDRERAGGSLDEGQYGPSRTALNGPPPVQNPSALYPWSQRRMTFTSSQPSPFPRYGAAVNAVASKDGDVYLMGGLVNGSTVKGDLWMIEAGGGNLACYPVGTTFEGPGPRVGHASLLVGNAFIVFGGDTKMDDRDSLDDTLYLLNTSTRHWSRCMPPGPKPAGRYGHTLNILGSRIYVFGGQVEGYFFNDLVAFDLNALQNSNSRWEFLIQNSNDGGPPEGQVPPARTNHTIIGWNDKLYLFGGTNGTQWFNDVWCYDPRQVAWTQLDCIGYIPVPREGHSAALVGDVMYIFGGRTEEGTDLGDLAAFRITSRRWYTFQNMGPSPSPRSGHSMTAYGKQIVVLAGEPSSAPRDPAELSLVYMLDTGKIRYPNDQQIQQTPSGERVPGNRRPSTERTAPPQLRGPASREGGPPPNNDGLRRTFSGSREDLSNRDGPPVSADRSQDTSMMNGPPPQGSLPQGPPGGNGVPQGPPGIGPRIPRASAVQSPGPPPQQQPPQPRTNGITSPLPGTMPQVPGSTGSRSRTPTRDNRTYGPPLDTDRANAYEKENVSPISPGTSRYMPQNHAISPMVNGRRTQQQQQQPQQQPQIQKRVDTMPDMEDPQQSMNGAYRSRSRQAADEESYGFPQPSPQQPRDDSSYDDTVVEHPPSKTHRQIGPSEQELRQQQQLEELASQQEALLSELESTRSRNAWYASELALARKAGYEQHSSQPPILDESDPETFNDDDQPLVEALVAMRAQLAEVQDSVDARVNAAAQEVSAVEQQRDVAIREAAYAKAKLAAHGGSTADTPQSAQSDGISRDLDSEERSSDIGRKLAIALATQDELRAQIQSMAAEIESEKQARELAEGTAGVAHKRVAEFEQSYNPGELEDLRSQLHQVSNTARDEAAHKAEAHARAELLEVDKTDLSRSLDEALENAKTHNTTFASLRTAVTASTDTTSHLERKLEEEKDQRETLEQKLVQLRAEHEERTAELDITARKLRDAEELAENHANEARTHRSALLAGLETLSNRSPDTRSDPYVDERISTLKQQVETAHDLMRQNQAEADSAAEKLRGAEERIAGLEAYQEQTSRESLATRKQLQDTVREMQALQGKHSGVLRDLESHQRDTSALTVQHNALKELLEERGPTPNSRFDTPDPSRVKELEQQLEDSLRAHQETKATSETKAQEADQSYREKLEQLEADYQSAVHYVKGTEKMLKRMKDELTKYKKQNEEMRKDLDTAERSISERSLDPEAAAEWEAERRQLHAEIGEMQQSVKETVSQLDRQLEEVRGELYEAQQQRDYFRQSHDQTQQQLSQTTRQARTELEQLKSENSMLESRAMDAEQKVTLLLDQVGTSVTNYRRQSQQMTNGHSHNPSTSSNITTPRGGPLHSQSNSITTDATFNIGPHAGVAGTETNNRNSVALDSLASELETLRTHWEGTHRNYRMSNQFDFERTPTSATSTSVGDGALSESLASWRKRLEQEEREKEAERRAGGASNYGGTSNFGNAVGKVGRHEDDSGSERGSSPIAGPMGTRPTLRSNESEVTGLTRGMPGALGRYDSDDGEDLSQARGFGRAAGRGNVACDRVKPCTMTSVHPLQPAQAYPSNNHTSAAPYVNGHVRHDSPGPSHRSTHSASSGEGLSMRDTDKSRNINQIPAKSRTQAEFDGASASRRGAANGLTNGHTLPSRPRGQLPRANTDHGPRARSPPKGGQDSDEHWEMRHGWEDEYNSSEILAKLNTTFYMYYTDKRHETGGKPKNEDHSRPPIDWRMRERLKTVSAALAICLNIGVDPPDVVKTNPTAKMECWLDPTATTQASSKVMEQIGKKLNDQYETLSIRVRYKLYLDPSVDETRKFCTSLRRNAKDERVLFHYNGHGVPLPTPSGEIWVFNRNYTQYIPVSLYDLQAWLGAPSLYVYDCSHAGNILANFDRFVEKHEAENAEAKEKDPNALLQQYNDNIQLAACGKTESLPTNPDLPADLFTCCLTTPIEISLRFFVLQNQLPSDVTLIDVTKVPGKLQERRTPLGELNWIFTAVTDTIAWNTLPRDIFRKLFRQDLMVAALFRNFLLSQRIMRAYGCHPMSVPKMPDTHDHPMWESWDLAMEMVLAQLPALIASEEENGPPYEYQHSNFFAEQLTAFEVYLAQGAPEQEAPAQLPIVLQVLLSQVHRLRALILLSKFLDLGPWAVNLALLIGIFPYVCKLLQSAAHELKPVMIFIWARILAVDISGQNDLIKDNAYQYFLAILGPHTPLPVSNASEHRAMSAFIIAMFCRNFRQAQVVCLSPELFQLCIHHLKDAENPLIRQWSCLLISMLWHDFPEAKWVGIRVSVHQRLCEMALDPVPEVRAAALHALTNFIGIPDLTEQVIQHEESIASAILPMTSDGNSMVRKELLVFFSTFVQRYQNKFMVAAYEQLLEERDRLLDGGDQPNGHRRARSDSSTSEDDRVSGDSVQGSMWRQILVMSLDAHPEVAQDATSIVDYVHEALIQSPLGTRAHTVIEDISRVFHKKPAQSRQSSAAPSSRTMQASASPVPRAVARNESYLSMGVRRTASVAAALKHLALGNSTSNASLHGPNGTSAPNGSSQQRQANLRSRMPAEWSRPPDEHDHTSTATAYHAAKVPATRGFIERDPTTAVTLPLETGFFDWSIEYFREPQMRPNEPDEPGSDDYNSRLWRRVRNEKTLSITQPQKGVAGTSRWDVSKGFLSNGSQPSKLCFHQFEEHLAVADDRDNVCIWNWQQNVCLNRFSNANPRGSRINEARFINEDDQALLMTGSSDGVIRFFRNYESEKEVEVVSAFRALTDIVPSNKNAGLVLDWQQGQGKLLVAGDVKVIRVWNAATEICTNDIPARSGSCITSLTSDQVAGDVFVGGYGDGAIRVFDQRLRPAMAMVKVWRDHKQWITNVHLQRGGLRELVSGSRNGEIKLWDIRKDEPLHTIRATKDTLRTLSVHEHAPVLATGTERHNVNVFNLNGAFLNTLEPYAGFLQQTRSTPIAATAFHPHRMMLACSALNSSHINLFTYQG